MLATLKPTITQLWSVNLVLSVLADQPGFVIIACILFVNNVLRIMILTVVNFLSFSLTLSGLTFRLSIKNLVKTKGHPFSSLTHLCHQN